MTRFPILTERLTGDQALKVGCSDCGATFQASSADTWVHVIDFGRCADCRSPRLVPVYEEAERCRGCGKVSLDLLVGGCCSRRCRLQADYAERLRVGGAGAASGV